MNELERNYFDALHTDRSETADMMEKPSMANIWRSIVEKYSDQAHFIYELIQNADDAGATSARFILEPDRLIFAHNGTRHFSITNPDTEKEDSENGCLGDINAITAIAFSNKSTQENKIGKFGVGFKAVFQYTSTPHIYDPEFCFRIDRYIVPTLLDSDFSGRREEETLFIFPFNHKDINAEETYKDISEKLKSLSYPTLFLTNLVNISFEIDKTIGQYEKNIEEHFDFEDTIAEKICLMQSISDEIITKYLWLFSRFDGALKYSIGFFLDDNNCLIPVHEPAFCYFPTKETTGLNFLIHAPFLLTDSREGIRAGIPHNNNMVSLLSELAADSMLYLRDIGINSSDKLITDDIFSIIPIQEDAFCDLDDVSRISFKPFYSAIKNVFETEELIPTRDGYTIVENAYWASVPFLTQLFDDAQLADICGNPDAKWGFLSLGRDEVQRRNKALFSYVESITKTWLNEDVIINGRFAVPDVWGYVMGLGGDNIKGIDRAFIERQDINWLHSLYKWLSETKHRTELVKRKPIFIDQELNAVAAFDKEEHLILFLPNKDISGYSTVHEDLLKNEETFEFIKKIGITEPSIHDQIYNVILPQYKEDDNADIDTDPHFMLFFNYYCQCPQDEVDDFIDEIKELEFINYYAQGDSQLYKGKAGRLYLPTEELIKYFGPKPDTMFVALDEYKNLVGASRERFLLSFLSELGVKTSLNIVIHRSGDINYQEDDPYIDGCKEIINEVVQKKDLELSSFVWEQLCLFIPKNRNVLKKKIISRLDRRHRWKTEYTESMMATLLRTRPWMIDKEGNFVAPNKLPKTNISEIYNMEIDGAAELIDLLGMPKEAEYEEEEKENDSNLSSEQRRIILCDQLGLTEEVLKKMLDDADNNVIDEIFDNINYDSGEGNDEEPEHQPKKKIHQATSRVAKDIIKRTNPNPIAYEDNPIDEYNDADEDEFTPSPVDFSRKAELEKQKAAKAIDKIVYQEEVQQRALNAPKYSYAWFKALLELEALNSNINNVNSKEVSISFARIEREPDTQRTLILKQPNRDIPQFMEDLADIPLVLHFGDKTKNLAIEVANVKQYTLRVRLKSHADIENVDLSEVTEARIDAKSPVFLLEALRKQFEELGYEDDYDMQKNLCENIEFVFGPPGTGKTTHLAKNVLIPLMAGKQDLKVLVLTPTNKAADVLVRRIMEVMDKDLSYNDWLVRFGGTGDELIEQSPVYRDKTFDIRTLGKNVTVTTIARFPYDFFMPQGARIYLNGINWDYIVIDEASMIPIANIVYPLYKKTPKKFIVAGDPFQIEPITAVSLWKNENIYTMVQLNSFVNPKTIPYNYKVEFLTTQYRSIPSVGSVFSRFAYGGILEHYRSESGKRSLNIENELPINTLNIIKFPVSKYESIYRSKKLKKSPYHIYSALFTFEFVIYLSNLIAKANPKSFFRIGVIAPYRVQADLIERLIDSVEVSKEIDIQVGTIHGFQGDECDIIFAVFNTPPAISSKEEMFLNKRNIVNVSISRAKDYLFVLMPDDDTDNINNLHLVKYVEQLFKSSGSYAEFKAHDLEQHIFGNACYLEENTFSTGHQNVNVYGLPEKCYEIRSEDAAVDVQLHRLEGINKQ